MLRLLLLALSFFSASAFAQAPDWRTAAPPLPLSAPITAMTAAVSVGGAAWGPWRKLCREQWERLDRTPRRDCLNVAAVERDATARATRISLAPEVLRGGYAGESEPLEVSLAWDPQQVLQFGATGSPATLRGVVESLKASLLLELGNIAGE